MKPFDYLIVGAGLFGAVFANRARAAGKTCLVIDKRSHIGGNIIPKSWKESTYTGTAPTSFTPITRQSGSL